MVYLGKYSRRTIVELIFCTNCPPFSSRKSTTRWLKRPSSSSSPFCRRPPPLVCISILGDSSSKSELSLSLRASHRGRCSGPGLVRPCRVPSAQPLPLGGRWGRLKKFQLPFLLLGPGAGQLDVPAAVERLDSIRKCHFFLCSCHDPGQHAAMEEAAAAAAAASRRASGTPGGQAARRSQIARADTRRVATDVATKPYPLQWWRY